jgi:hypothetical protein
MQDNERTIELGIGLRHGNTALFRRKGCPAKVSVRLTFAVNSA